jgi:phosphatidylethanolamine/phosphatidyl-N-methylethanolamine N-methyltransferase
LDDKSIIKSYKRVSSFYDYTFGKVFRPGQKKLVSMMECTSTDKVLEIGIGTGTSYSFYPEETSVVGIDISPDMLQRAENHIRTSNLKNKRVIMMNGENLDFEDNSFDKVVGMYVVSVTQNPGLLIKEMKRVCKPNGDIYLVNHFSFDTDNRIVKFLEKRLMPISKYLGWRPYFPFSEFNAYAKLNVQSISKINIFDYWGIIHAINSPAD